MIEYAAAMILWIAGMFAVGFCIKAIGDLIFPPGKPRDR